jgi:hypothetical protein
MARIFGALGVALATLALVTACGSHAPGEVTARASRAACPAAAPRLDLTPAGKSRLDRTAVAGAGAGLVPAGPVSAVVCQYGGQVAGRPRRVTLGMAAAGLAAVIDSAQPVPTADRRCAAPRHLDPFAQELLFAYAKGPVRPVTADSTDCNVGLLRSGRVAGELPFQTEADLFAYTSITTLASGSAPTPSLIGLSARAAVVTARRHHFSVGIDGGALDLSARPGTVVFQSLPAGARDSGPGGSVDVIVAVGRAAGCNAGQLALTYLGGGEGAGNDFGTLLIRDTSARPCTLTGPLTVTGLGSGGRPDTSTGRDQLAGTAVLTPAAGPVRWRPPGTLAGTRPGELTGAIALMSEYRDGPARVDNGLCEPLWVVPATWRVTVPGAGALIVANADAENPARLVRSGGLVTCRGHLGLTAPATVGTP